jgi:hypothetical protein
VVQRDLVAQRDRERPERRFHLRGLAVLRDRSRRLDLADREVLSGLVVLRDLERPERRFHRRVLGRRRNLVVRRVLVALRDRSHRLDLADREVLSGLVVLWDRERPERRFHRQILVVLRDPVALRDLERPERRFHRQVLGRRRNLVVLRGLVALRDRVHLVGLVGR